MIDTGSMIMEPPLKSFIFVIKLIGLSHTFSLFKSVSWRSRDKNVQSSKYSHLKNRSNITGYVMIVYEQKLQVGGDSVRLITN